MKFLFIFLPGRPPGAEGFGAPGLLLVSALLGAAACSPSAISPLPDSASPAREQTLQQIIAILDYVAADYALAVQAGRVISDIEYQEQQSLVTEALRLVETLPSGGAQPLDPAGPLETLLAQIRAREEAERVRATCGALRQAIVDGFQLVLAPLSPPSFERAGELYAQACAKCHGLSGRPDPVEAARHVPPPTDLTDEQVMRDLTPYRAYSAITFGIQGTDMASFDSLPAGDRWSLAFLVAGLRHGQANARRGERAYLEAGRPVAATAARLSQLSDAEIEAALEKASIERARLPDVLTYLRRSAPYAADPSGPLRLARGFITRAVELYRAGDIQGARRSALRAYLEGFEPREAEIRAREPELVVRTERAFLDLRADVERAAPVAEVERRAAALGLLLDRAEESRRDRSLAFLSSFTIALREGLEAGLLIAALLAFLHKAGRLDQSRYVHRGWIAAVPAGALTWWLVGEAVDGAQRELAEGILALAAAAVLLTVSHWFIGGLEARQWIGFIGRRLTNAARAGRPWSLAVVAFVAVYREALEVVLFYQTLLLEENAFPLAIAAGAATGLAVLVLVVLVFQRLGRKLKPRAVFLGSGLILSCLAVVFAGRGIRALQEGGYLPLTWIELPEEPWLGFYPTLEGVAIQLALVATLVVTTAYPAFRSRERRAA